MSEENHGELQFDEVNVLPYFLVSISKPRHKNLLTQQIDLLEEPVVVDETGKLGDVHALGFSSDESWKSSYAVRD